MKTSIALTTLALLATPAWANHFNSNPDMEQSILNVHAAPFPHQSGATHEPERGSGDTYGSILLDVNKESHTPHPRVSHSHAPEQGKGDLYGSILLGRSK